MDIVPRMVIILSIHLFWSCVQFHGTIWSHGMDNRHDKCSLRDARIRDLRSRWRESDFVLSDKDNHHSFIKWKCYSHSTQRKFATIFVTCLELSLNPKKVVASYTNDSASSSNLMRICTKALAYTDSDLCRTRANSWCSSIRKSGNSFATSFRVSACQSRHPIHSHA